MRVKLVVYWIATSLVVLELFAGALIDLTQQTNASNVMTELGYPAYLMTILGVWKLLGGVALLVPGFARLKEWAYAGAFFELTGAAASHALVGDPQASLIAPLALSCLILVSWALRPESRNVESVSAHRPAQPHATTPAHV